MDVIRKYCSRAGFMKNGEMKYFGDTEEAIAMYLEDNN
jgi:ABC-type polysaccharide/polyol phosphate transport system ATPase subunit